MARRATKRVPPVQMPRTIQNQYYKEISKLLEKNRKFMWEAFQKTIQPEIHNFRASIDSGVRSDDAFDVIEREIDRVRSHSEKILFNDVKLNGIAATFVQRLNQNNRLAFKNQIKSVAGIDPLLRDPWLDSFTKIAIRENVNWIRSIEKEYFDKVETIIYNGTRRGQSINEIAAGIKKTAKTSDTRAKFIARDQTGSLYGDMTKYRNKEVGIKEFTWITSLDERVRGNPSGTNPNAPINHWELHGRTFSWGKGVEEYGGLLPGQDYNCRCTASPVIDDVEKLLGN